MGANSKIQWTDHTFNPWWGCTRIAPACDHCYAEAFAKRLGKNIWGKTGSRPIASEKYWREPIKWNAAAEAAGERRRVFCASMADVCEDRHDLIDPRADLMTLIETTPWLDWLLLTKRPENFNRFFGQRWVSRWPSNVIAMATAENQQRLDFVVNELAQVPALRRGLSIEPLLQDVSLRRAVAGHPWHTINWAIIGGESGASARPFCIDWALQLVHEAKALGITPFVKQLGLKPYTNNLNVWDLPEHVGAWGESRLLGAASAMLKFKDKKGGDWSEWPEELRVREFYDELKRVSL